MLLMNAKIMISVTLIAILGVIVYLNVNKIYAEQFIRLSVPLTEDEIQHSPNQLSFHMDNHTNGAVEVVSIVKGQYIIQYFHYNPDRNSVTVSNSTITADFAIQTPDRLDPNTFNINRIQLPVLDVQHITIHSASHSDPAYITN